MDKKKMKEREINKKKMALEAALYYTDNNATIRDTAKHLYISKTTVHNLLKIVHKYNARLGKKVDALRAKNLSERTMRGGLATKRKYELLKEGKLK